MKKSLKGKKNCTIGVNCKSTCIEREKECLKVKKDATIKSAVEKIAATRFQAQKQLDKFKSDPRIPTANAFLAKLFEDSDKQDGYGATVTGKNADIIQTAVKDFQAATKTKLRINSIEEKVGVGSSADRRNGLITIAQRDNSIKTRTEVLHELGHFLEKANSANEKAARNWLDSKKTGKPELLSKLSGNPNFKAETAYPGNFFDPYVGKFYMSGATEVYSKGFENFASGKQLVEFYNRAPDHFDLIMGALT